MIYMSQEEITILRVHKDTRDRLRKLAITKRESFEEIINRLLGSERTTDDKNELEERKQKLLNMGIAKELVDLLGVIPKTDTEDDRKIIREAVKRWAYKKR
jgi:hypothetical protein